MLLNHHNFSLPIRKSRGFAVGKTHLVRLKPSSLAHECGYWGESKAGVVHVHILAVSFRGITQKVRLSIYIICIASLMPMHTHSDIYICIIYYIYTYTQTHNGYPGDAVLHPAASFLGTSEASWGAWLRMMQFGDRRKEVGRFPIVWKDPILRLGLLGIDPLIQKFPQFAPFKNTTPPHFFLVPTWFHH